MILVDTNVLSELMRRKPDKGVRDWMDGLQGSDVGITAISVAEILYGIGSLVDGRKKQRLLEAARTLFEEYFAGRILAFDQIAAIEYADIVLQRERSGSPISMPDAQIAAVCRISSAGLGSIASFAFPASRCHASGIDIPDLERFTGCLFGLAAGDALGTAVEFQPPGSSPPRAGHDRRGVRPAGRLLS